MEGDDGTTASGKAGGRLTPKPDGCDGRGVTVDVGEDDKFGRLTPSDEGEELLGALGRDGAENEGDVLEEEVELAAIPARGCPITKARAKENEARLFRRWLAIKLSYLFYMLGSEGFLVKDYCIRMFMGGSGISAGGTERGGMESG